MQVVLGSGVSVGEDVMGADAVTEAQRQREDQYRAHQVCGLVSQLLGWMLLRKSTGHIGV